MDRLKAQTTENELLRKELRNVRAKLEQEQSSRSANAAQYFLDQHLKRRTNGTSPILWLTLNSCPGNAIFGKMSMGNGHGTVLR